MHNFLPYIKVDISQLLQVNKRPVEANNPGGRGSRRAVEPSDDDD
jgi:hypothetical protein